MALQKELTLPNGRRLTYHRIEYTDENLDGICKARMCSYENFDHRATCFNAPHTTEFTFLKTTDNVLADAYNQIKTQFGWADATDV